VKLQRLRNLAANGQHRVEGRHRILKNHRNLAASDATHLLVADLEQVAAVEPDLAGHGPRRRMRDQTHEGHSCHAFATARLTDEA
jgi:hypothetical protein